MAQGCYGSYNWQAVYSLPQSDGDWKFAEGGEASCLAALQAGKMSYVADGNTVERDIHGGVADVKDNVVSVCLY